jgi:SAM-dependent methyltransferase
MWDDPVLYDLENADDPAFDLAFWTWLVSSSRPGRVLELACGTGRLTLPLAALGVAGEIVGLDASPTFLAHARSRVAVGVAGSPGAPRTAVSFVEGDMRSPAVDGAFDLVAIPFNSLAYVLTPVDRAAVLHSARALLSPGGRFAFDVVAPRYDLLYEALQPTPERVDIDHAAVELGVDRMTRRYVDHYDPSTQILRSENRYEITWSDGRVEHRTTDLLWHIAFPAQLESELAAAGLHVTERYGGWNREPWGPTARRIIWICEAA